MKPSIDEIVRLPALQGAPALVGCLLHRRLPQGVLRLKIVETEAYHQDDPASHSFRGLTARTAPMFQSGGRLYVYFTYGMHYCLNVVTGPAGRGEAVLLRAAQPLEGIEIMQTNRGIKDIRHLANGPGKLAQALGISNTLLSGKKLSKLSIWLEPGQPVQAHDIAVGPRVGIRRAAAEPLRFYLKSSPFVSKP